MVDSLRKMMLEVSSSNPTLWILKIKTSLYCSLRNFIISVFEQLFLNFILFFLTRSMKSISFRRQYLVPFAINVALYSVSITGDSLNFETLFHFLIFSLSDEKLSSFHSRKFLAISLFIISLIWTKEDFGLFLFQAIRKCSTCLRNAATHINPIISRVLFGAQKLKSWF